MNSFSSHDGLKHPPNPKSAVIIVFPMHRACRRAAPKLSEITVSATEELHCDVGLLRRGQEAENVNRLLHLRILQAAVFALKLSGQLLPKWAPNDGWTNPLSTSVASPSPIAHYPAVSDALPVPVATAAPAH